MDATVLESFFQAAMKEEPLDYYEYSDIDYGNEQFEPIKIKEEILDEIDDSCMANTFMESVEVQPYNDHTYANMNYENLDIHIKEENIDHIKTEYLEEENIYNFVDVNAMISEIEMQSKCATSRSSIDNVIIEEIIYDIPILDGIHEFHDFIDKPLIKQEELIIEETTHDEDYNEFLKNKRLSQVPYKCKHCFYTFKLFSDLQQHMQKHFIRNVFKCKNCTKEFVTMQDLIKHEFTHVSANVYACSFCKKVYFNSSRYKLHLKKHNEDSLECPNCRKKISTKCLVDHQRICNFKAKIGKKIQEKYIVDANADANTKEHFYSCNRCDQTFIYKSERDLHRNEECCYKCRFCGDIFQDNIVVENHVKDVHPGKELHICKLCYRTFLCRRSIIPHLKKHNRSTQLPQTDCKVCGKSLNYLSEKTCTCIENIHQNDLERQSEKPFKNKIIQEPLIDVLSDEKLYSCVYCEKKFSSEWNKVKHMITHRYEFNIMKQNAKPSTASQDSTQQYKLGNLDQNIKFEQNCNQESKELHSYNYSDEKLSPKKELSIVLERFDIRQLQCHICEKIFVQSKAKELHMKIHELNIKCNICCESFNNTRSLEKHLKVHDKLMFECDICDETFLCLQDQENHIAKHGAYRHGKFNCNICDKLFISQSTYKRHMYIHKL